MVFPIVKELIVQFKYLVILNCKIQPEHPIDFIPSFDCNKTTSYFIKDLNSLIKLIEEIFFVWRYKYHSSIYPHVRTENNTCAERLIEKIKSLDSFPIPYLECKIKGEEKYFSGLNCTIKIFPMRKEFSHLLDLTSGSEILRKEFVQDLKYAHRIIPYIVYKDKHTNRIKIHISGDPFTFYHYNDQTYCKVAFDSNFCYYDSVTKKLGLEVKDKKYFDSLIKSGNSFLLTKDDFYCGDKILYANIYFLSPVNLLVTSVEEDVYFLKMSHVVKMLDELTAPRLLDTGLCKKIMSFL